MILTGQKIHNEIIKKNIIIEPFNIEQITTNSYDLKLGDTYIKYLDEVIDSRISPKYELKTIPDEGLLLNPGDFILGHSEETIGSNQYVPLIHAKSSTARTGLFVHITADLIDIGSIGNTTFQLFATLPVRIYKGMLLAQVTFWKSTGDIELYAGKYQNSKGPQPSKSYLDNEVTE